jgi:hypothetical protein
MTTRKLLIATVLIAILMSMGTPMVFADNVTVTPPGQDTPVQSHTVGTPCNCPGPTYPGAALDNPSGVAVFDAGSPACNMDHPPGGPFSP